MTQKKAPTSRIAHNTEQDVFVRGESLTKDLIGQLTFTEMMFFQILGRRPSVGETAVLDACLVALLEHGLTPTVITTRMTYTSAPESLQGAVAAGIASVGSLFVGTVEGCAHLLSRMVRSNANAVDEAKAIIAEHQARGARLAGFGHPIHRPDDPRTEVILAVAERHGVAGVHIQSLRTLSREVDRALGKHVTINATGAVAAALGDAGVPAEIMRGFAVISRCAGLVGHIREEQLAPLMQTLWMAGDSAVAYEHASEIDDESRADS